MREVSHQDAGYPGALGAVCGLSIPKEVCPDIHKDAISGQRSGTKSIYIYRLSPIVPIVPTNLLTTFGLKYDYWKQIWSATGHRDKLLFRTEIRYTNHALARVPLTFPQSGTNTA
jgi:hypothetical protein